MSIKLSENYYRKCKHRITNDRMYSSNIPEHSLDPIEKSLGVLIHYSYLTHRQLAKAMKVSPVTIHNYLHGNRTNPEPEFMRKLADFFDVKPSYFLEYRLWLLSERLSRFPELVDVFLDLASDPGGVVREYERLEVDERICRDMLYKKRRKEIALKGGELK